MLYHAQLQDRDYAILEPLVYAYRMTTAYLEAERFSVSLSTMRRRLNQLTRSRFLARLTAWASKVPLCAEPIFEWQLGDPDPPFGELAYQCQKRWKDNPVRRTTIYIAANKLLSMYSLPKRRPVKLLQATHDLSLVSCFNYCRNAFPHLQFVGEEIYTPSRGHGEGVEDAQLLDGDRLVTGIEHAGSYRKDRLIHFHQHMSERSGYLLF